MKNFCVFVLVLMLCSVCFAAQKKNDETHIGILGYLGTTEEEFQDSFDNVLKYIADNASNDEFVASIIIETQRKFHFYDSLMALLMGLRSGRIDEIILPESCGRYIVRHNSAFAVKFSTKMLASGISFGFREDNPELKNEFDAVIKEMKADGTLNALAEKYITNPTNETIYSITPQKFENAPTIKVAVTGDMPPIDMFAGDGKPTGYNTAVLAEIGRRLGKNIRLVNTQAGGRSAALFSGRADVVFWYRTTESTMDDLEEDPLEEILKDKIEGIILSEPYYFWNNELIISKAERNTLKNFFSR